ncbi:methyl-accepting chemotaxis protein [Faecalicatena contorta]|uniref:Methyl-accepting chemotaxis protein n=1 Tax=Faecalicatena contorta TaxID=39482 RepID=A0A315ZY05_9FIRM|nr:methyl-accepting chemotaxis protein [Faecalicatena contorta]PWJ50551.1 methyl-accepting chemotaxis protein [Faecalicatena contorta]SUQ13959.1 methyl-accepting chemotaxis protein [Faecalicatena contorta]
MRRKKKRKGTPKEMKVTTIKREIQRIIILLLATALVLAGGISCYLNYISTSDALKGSMPVTATEAASEVQAHLHATMNIVEMIGTIPQLASGTLTPSQKHTLLDGYKKNYGWETVFVTNNSGVDNVNHTDISNTQYFKTALSGTTSISDPVYDKLTEKLAVVITAPLWKDGRQNTEVVGTVGITIDARSLTDIVSDIKVSKNGGAYILNADGRTIAHENFDLVINEENDIEASKEDASLKEIAVQEKKMTQGQSGFGKYKYNGQSKYIAYAPIGINGWSLGVTTPASDFMDSTIKGLIIIAVSLAIILLIGAYVARRTGKHIGEAVSLCTERLKLLAAGDLTTEVPEIKSKNETLVLAQSTSEIVYAQQNIIGDVSYLLSEMAGGNFNVHSGVNEEMYVGEYHEILLSIQKLRLTLSGTIHSIKDASEQVEAGAAQLSSGAQGLAQGASEQASAVEELLSTATTVTKQVEDTTKATDAAHDKAKLVEKEATVSQDKMTELTEAMKRIESTSNEIKNIIGGIEDIAAQTNLLSLNASIEAARAGAAGKGFAVVADQIGKLAEQSTQSAVNTRELIETSISEVSAGSRITDETAEALKQVIDGLDEIVLSVADVRNASDKQTLAVEQIEQGVAQISSVVQSNSAAAEESSATSEELSAQAQSLNHLVSQFKLGEN